MTQLQAPVTLPHPGRLLIIEPLDYPNPYDYHAPHRHDYFEIILVDSGQGHQYIDFSPYPISSGEVFTIYPGQVHLMQRNSAQGLLIQFRKDIFEFIYPVKHIHLYFTNPAFRPKPAVYRHLYNLAENMYMLLQRQELSHFSIHKAYSYLQIMLITLTELHHETAPAAGTSTIAQQFLSLLPQHIRTQRKVSDYCEMIGCSPDKLNTACKAALGKTVLKLIHEELLLEIRRLLILNTLSLKEIAYELNFDSPANFSGFIKANTGQTPSEMQATVRNIYS